MPKISRYFIKSGLLYLLFGVLVFAFSEFPGAKWEIHLMPVYWHMIALGWVTQIIIGVSLWMYPKGNKSTPKDGSTFAWVAYFSLNLGLILRIFSEPLIYQSRDILILPYCLSIILQFMGILCYVLEIWPRLKSQTKS
ncbi:hypothetical protein EHQ68_13000 [Leptospira congkakensis]|uniref:Cytochrome C and Quinol oxidase polypeptide I n=1 Tax=Leptospira congkakensis TaxID=2484932 RepID=A0A4Z0ZYL2_9LEPT|nr:hypothetical protein [Leptospira congkakensis]TGL86244.1 hypothetical protein EHQ68_13000 [Leptospira congkakensis]TGL94212.1 hypothetical protein EHQ69_07030 [Leptospira congkakensis]TGL94379.1 hypothetical protein EHQ70_13760 [Leptospira congkakensis]